MMSLRAQEACLHRSNTHSSWCKTFNALLAFAPFLSPSSTLPTARKRTAGKQPIADTEVRQLDLVWHQLVFAYHAVVVWMVARGWGVGAWRVERTVANLPLEGTPLSLAML